MPQKRLKIASLIGFLCFSSITLAFNETTRAILNLQSSLPDQMKCNESQSFGEAHFQTEEGHRFGIVQITLRGGQVIGCVLNDSSADRVSVYANRSVSRLEVLIDSGSDNNLPCQISVNASGFTVQDAKRGLQATCTNSVAMDK